MICSLLIMMIVFINGMESAEQKVKHLDTVLREEELDAKTKAWLLMVESGKVDEEEVRRITPKSIFIAPLLNNHAAKCQEGYRHDHLGQCVKVIKTDPKVQLELLLKKLNSLYSEKKKEEEEEEKELSEASTGPLQFSIPILNEEEKNMKFVNEESLPNPPTQVNESDFSPPKPPEFIPVPMPVVTANHTLELNLNHTKDLEFSGAGPLNDTEIFVPTAVEGSGAASGDSSPIDDTTPVESLFFDDSDLFDSRETESTSTIPTTTEIFPSTTVAPVEESHPTNSYQSITGLLSLNHSVKQSTTESVQKPENDFKNIKSDIIHFPREDDERTFINSPPAVNNGGIRFPEESTTTHQVLSYRPPQTFYSQYQILPSAIPTQQFWWVPKNWRVDENYEKSPLIKFWSRIPLIHDVSITHDGGNDFRRPFPSPLPAPRGFTSRQVHEGFPETYHQFNHQQQNRKVFRRGRLLDESSPSSRETFRFQR